MNRFMPNNSIRPSKPDTASLFPGKSLLHRLLRWLLPVSRPFVHWIK